MKSNSRLILIRHGIKQWKNGHKPKYVQGFNHDPPLTAFQPVLINTKYQLIYMYGLPDKIICSPLLRCRQTAMILSQFSNKHIPIFVDELLRSSLGKWERKDVGISPDTLQYITDNNLVETQSQFNNRVKQILNQTYIYENVWIVTHSSVISELTKIFNIIKRHPKEGNFITISK